MVLSRVAMPRLLVISFSILDLYKTNSLNSFSASGNIEIVANNTDSGESARNELSHLNSASFAF